MAVEGQIVMAIRFDQSISKAAALRDVAHFQWSESVKVAHILMRMSCLMWCSVFAQIIQNLDCRVHYQMNHHCNLRVGRSLGQNDHSRQPTLLHTCPVRNSVTPHFPDLAPSRGPRFRFFKNLYLNNDLG